MSIKLTPKILGQRISALRKIKGLSQEDLARSFNMPRSSLTQLELGNRGIDVLELQQLSLILGFSINDFLADNFSIGQGTTLIFDENLKKKKERVATPTLQINKLQNVLLYILERCAGKPNVGETVLYKLIYFSDFNYFELYEEHLTGISYRKLPYGPVPQKFDTVINHMLKEGLIQMIKTMYYNKIQLRYLPLAKPDLTTLKASEKEVIDKVIDQLSDWSAKAISSYSHKDMPWLATDEGEIINYELVFYREAPFSVRTYEDENE